MFGLSGSKSSSSSSSSATGRAEDWTQASSIAGGYQGSESLSSGASQSYGVSQDRLAFEDMYKKLYGGAAGAAEGMASNPFLSDTANQLFQSGQSILGNLQNDAGSNYLASILTSNEGVDEQIGLLGQDLGKFLNEQAMPSARRNASLSGQLGGSRQGVAESAAIDQTLQQFARGSAEIRSQNMARQAMAASQLSQQDLAAAQIGLVGNEQQYGLAQQGFMSQLSPYAALASIYGDKTTLGSSLQTSSSYDSAIAKAFGEDFSASQQTGYGYDFSDAKSKSKSSSGSFGIGF